MKRVILLLLLITPLLLSAQPNLGKELKVTQRLAKIIFYRGKSNDLKSKGSPVELNGNYLTTIWNNSFYTYEIWPQECKLTLNEEEKSEIRIKLIAGEKYYIRISVESIADGFIQIMELTSEKEALKYLEENRLRNSGSYNPVTDSLRRIKTQMNWAGSDVFSLGIVLGPGVGFKSTEMVELSNGSSSKISAGGGVVVGIEAAYRFIPRFEICAEMQFQSSSLIPVVSNATVSFDRVAMGISPRFTLPFGKDLRFNIGPGIAMFQAVKMEADLTKLTNGFKGEFKYKPATGYYLSADMDYYFRSCSFGIGLKYSKSDYTLSSAVVDGYTIPVEDSNLDYYRNFSGDGIFFFALFRVHL
jgi:hypothetical protein